MKSTRQQHGAPRKAWARASSPAAANGAAAGMPRFLRRAPDSAVPEETAAPTRLAQAAPTDWASREERLPCCDQLDDAQTFAGGSYDPVDRIGPGGLGGFTAWYFPFGGRGILHIVESGAVAFKDLLVISGGIISPHPDLPAGTAALTALAARIQALPEPDRSNALAQYQWTTAEESAWLTDLELVVERAWSWQHSFFLNRPCWEWIGADTNVDVRLHTGPKTAEDHMDVESYKTAAGESLPTFGLRAQVAHGSGTNVRDQSMRLASTNIGGNANDLLRASVEFAHDSDVLSAAAQTSLRAFIARYNGASAHVAWSRARIDLIGRASSSGSTGYNQALSERRAAAVRVFLQTNGLSDAPIRVQAAARGELDAVQSSDDAQDRRVDLVVDGGARMVAAVHEFGHVLGLGDEYATSTSAIGSDATHHDLARNMTDSSGRHLPGAAVEHTGGVMSFGSEVRPQHGATFHAALEEVSHQQPWSLGNRSDPRNVEAKCSGAGMPPCTGDECVADATTHPGPDEGPSSTSVA